MEDQTRKMLNIIRESKKNPNKGLLREQEDMEPVDQMEPTGEFETADVEESVGGGDMDEKEIDAEEVKEEQDKFRQSVHNRVEFNKFKLYPNSQNVEWGGKFTDSGIEWFYSLDDSTGVYISNDMLQLRDETLEVIKKLVGYYKAWGDEWANRISEEYNSTEDSTEEVAFEEGDDLPDEEESMM